MRRLLQPWAWLTDTSPARQLQCYIERAQPNILFHACRQQLCDKVETACLDRQQLVSLELAPFLRLPRLKSLHLQHNCLTALPQLNPHLVSLCFLSIAYNSLKTLQPVMHLPALMTLDASHNLIEVCCMNHFPTSLRFLDVSGSSWLVHLPLGFKDMLLLVLSLAPRKYQGIFLHCGCLFLCCGAFNMGVAH
jgi:hypothetical protein